MCLRVTRKVEPSSCEWILRAILSPFPHHPLRCGGCDCLARVHNEGTRYHICCALTHWVRWNEKATRWFPCVVAVQEIANYPAGIGTYYDRIMLKKATHRKLVQRPCFGIKRQQRRESGAESLISIHSSNSIHQLRFRVVTIRSFLFQSSVQTCCGTGA